MSHRCLAAVFALIAVLALSAIPVTAQTAPQTSWGQPDLQGVWDFRTITPMQRPEDLGDQEFLTEEEAANLDQEAVDRDARLWEQDARRTEAGGRLAPTTISGWTGARKPSGPASVPMVLNPEPIFEYACHEGNYSMAVMLGGTRAAEAQAAADAATESR